MIAGAITKQHQNDNNNKGDNQQNLLTVEQNEGNFKPRGSVIYQKITQQKSKNKGSVEDGRKTKFYYERYRCIELCRFMLMLIAQGMNILSYDLEFEERDQFANDLISYVIFVSTIFLIIMTLLGFFSKLDYDKACNLVPEQANLINTGRWKSLSFVLFLQLIFPYPWTGLTKIEFQFLDENTGLKRTVYYNLNEILTLIMLIRVVIMVQSVLIFSKFAGARPQRVCNFYACKSDNLFIVKCMMSKYPMTVFWFLYTACILIFAFAIRICERPLVRLSDEYWQNQIEPGETLPQFDQNFNSYLVSLWCVFISLPTVGYGDRFPRTLLGRIILTITAILGAFLFSILVTALSNSLKLSNSEGKSVTVLTKIRAKDKLKQAASLLLILLGKVKYKRKKGLHISDKEKDNINYNLNKYKQTHVGYKSIKSEFSLYEQLERELEYIRKQFEEFKTQNQYLVECEQAMEEFIEGYNVKCESDLNSEDLNHSKSHRVGFMEGFEQTETSQKIPQYNFEVKENTKNMG